MPLVSIPPHSRRCIRVIVAAASAPRKCADFTAALLSLERSPSLPQQWWCSRMERCRTSNFENLLDLPEFTFAQRISPRFPISAVVDPGEALGSLWRTLLASE